MPFLAQTLASGGLSPFLWARGSQCLCLVWHLAGSFPSPSYQLFSSENVLTQGCPNISGKNQVINMKIERWEWTGERERRASVTAGAQGDWISLCSPFSSGAPWAELLIVTLRNLGEVASRDSLNDKTKDVRVQANLGCPPVLVHPWAKASQVVGLFRLKHRWVAIKLVRSWLLYVRWDFMLQWMPRALLTRSHSAV